MKVADVDDVFRDVVTVLVRRAIADATSNAAAGQGHGETARVMIAAV